MIDALAPLQLLLALAIILVAATLQGAVGIGYSLVAAPLLALLNPALAPEPVISTSIVLSVLVAARERQAIAFHEISWAWLGYVPGALVAGYLLSRISADAISLLFGGLILLAVALSSLRPHLPFSPATLLPTGLLSGFMGTTAAIAGPPIALLYQHRQAADIRATLNLYFAGAGLLSLTTLMVGGRFGQVALTHSLLLLPATVLGFLLSSRFIALLDRGFIRPLILALSAAAAILVIMQTIQGA